MPFHKFIDRYRNRTWRASALFFLQHRGCLLICKYVAPDRGTDANHIPRLIQLGADMMYLFHDFCDEPPPVLIQALGKPSLVGTEKLEDYETCFFSISSAIKPSDAIGWLLTRDITDLTWEIRRERNVKAEIIKHYQKEVVAELLPALAPPGQHGTAMYRIFQADDDLKLWANDPKARIDIEKALTAEGYDASYILAQAYLRGTDAIDAIDRRIAAYERRRNTALKEAGLWNEILLRRLEQATPEFIEGEFTEAAA